MCREVADAEHCLKRFSGGRDRSPIHPTTGTAWPLVEWFCLERLANRKVGSVGKPEGTIFLTSWLVIYY